MLEIRNLSKSFDEKTVLNNVSAGFEEGRISVIYGNNGSGKTTLFRCIAGITKPDQGEVIYKGRKLLKQETGYLPEKGALYQNSTAEQQLDLIAGMKNMNKDRTAARTNELLRIFQAEDLRNRKLSDLSKGNRQKIRIAGALINDPPLVILDEPFTALDQDNQQVLIKVLGILRQKRKTVLLSCHEPKIVNRIADEVFFLENGEIRNGLKRSQWENDQRRVIELEVNEEFFTMEKYRQTSTGIRIIAANQQQAAEMLERYRKDINVLRISIGQPELEDYFPGNNL